jgi:hypothetical protein
MPIERKIKMAETKEPNYLTNICGRCGEPQLGVHYHESEEEEETDLVEFALSTECSCETYDEDTDTYSPSDNCYGDCWTDAVDNLENIVLDPWLTANGWEKDTPILIVGSGMGWQRRSGYKESTAESLVEDLAFGSDFTLYFEFDGKDLTCRRTSHDEPTGSHFEFRLGVDPEEY